MSAEGISRTKLFEDVSERIMEMIRSEEYPAGARLPSEQQLAQRFEVSRNTVRGAIRSLSIFGLLRSINGSGTFVSERANVILEAQALASIMAHPDALLELVQARCVLEPQLAAMGFCTLYAIVTGENQNSVAFHERLGFQKVAVMPRVGYKFGRWQDTIWLMKVLREGPPGPAPLPPADLKNC